MTASALFAAVLMHDAPGAAATEPTGQTHACEPRADDGTYETGHVGAHAVAPGALTKPFAHAAHTDASGPSATPAVPAAQGVQWGSARPHVPRGQP